MFESAEIGHKISKSEYRKQEPALREQLLEAQAQLKEQARFPLLILIGGVDGAGKGETVNLLNEWMDPRHIHTCAFGAPTDEEAQRPPMWRYWRALPPKGKIGILFGSWYTEPIVEEDFERSGPGAFERSMHEIKGSQCEHHSPLPSSLRTGRTCSRRRRSCRGRWEESSGVA